MNSYERLTLEEVKVIREFGQALRELASGIRNPQSKAQERFVRVCRGEEAPETIYEIAYVKNARREQALGRQSGNGQESYAQKRNTSHYTVSKQSTPARRRRHELEISDKFGKTFSAEEMRAQKLINQMLTKSVWLSGRDQRFIESISTQLREGRKLSSKQILAVGVVYKRFLRNQQPQFVRG